MTAFSRTMYGIAVLGGLLIAYFIYMSYFHPDALATQVPETIETVRAFFMSARNGIKSIL